MQFTQFQLKENTQSNKKPIGSLQEVEAKRQGQKQGKKWQFYKPPAG